MLSQRFRVAALSAIFLAAGLASGDANVNSQTSTTKPADPQAAETVWYDIHDLLDTPVPATANRSEAKANLVEELIKLITDGVDPASWQVNGGSCTVSFYSNRLIITQTPPTHAQIKSFLDKLRLIHSDHGRFVTVDAYWLRLTPAQIPSVQSSLNSSLLTDANAVWARARASGFEGDSVTVSVNRTGDIVSAITPVVAPGVVAYDPTTTPKTFSLSLTETPTQIGADSLQLTFDSTAQVAETNGHLPATRPTTEPSGILFPLTVNSGNEVVGSVTSTIQAASVVRLKFGVPTVVSGMSDHPGASDNRTLCLILCATVANEK